MRTGVARALALVGLFGLATPCVLFACGLDARGDAQSGGVDATTDTTSAPDVGALADTGTDAGIDAGDDAADDAFEAAVDACTPSSFTCNGECVSSCNGCDAGTTVCPVTRECGHCGVGCTGFELECIACFDGGAPVAFCDLPSDQCSALGQNDHCPCADGDAAACPAATQVCQGQAKGQCFACGENGTDNGICANGGQCDTKNGAPTCGDGG
jgi:hypothetical protein